MILYMYDPCSLYMNNVGWGGWCSDKQLSRKCVFILTPKHIATSVQVSVILCGNQICFSMHKHLLDPERGVEKCTLLTSHFVMNAE